MSCRVVLTGHRGCPSHDSGVILVESLGNEAPAQEGPSWSLPVHVVPALVWSLVSLM
jgi:hypothetical protein